MLKDRVVRGCTSGDAERTIRRTGPPSGTQDGEPTILFPSAGFPIRTLLANLHATEDDRSNPVLARIPDCRAGNPVCRAGEGACPPECVALAESLRWLGWIQESATVRVTATTDSGTVTFSLGPLTKVTPESPDADARAGFRQGRELDDGAELGSAAGVSRDQRAHPSGERESIRVWIQSEDPDLRTRLLQELAEHADIEAHPGSILDRSHLPPDCEARPQRVILLDNRAFAAMSRDSREAVCALAANHAVLLLLDAVSGDLVHEILRYRFRGYLLTACAGDSVAKAVRAVRNGEYWLPRSILAEALQLWVAASANSSDAAVPVHVTTESFTSREQEVLTLVKRGLSNKQIANELGVVEDTVKKHLQHIYDKLGVRRRTLVLASGVSV